MVFSLFCKSLPSSVDIDIDIETNAAKEISGWKKDFYCCDLSCYLFNSFDCQRRTTATPGGRGSSGSGSSRRRLAEVGERRPDVGEDHLELVWPGKPVQPLGKTKRRRRRQTPQQRGKAGKAIRQAERLQGEHRYRTHQATRR
jgi:hypothetical protein